MAEYETTRGKILYLSDGEEWGREWFHRTEHGDGTRTYRTVSEIDGMALLRDVTHTALADFRPLECYARIRLEEEISSGWFLFSDQDVTCEAHIAGMGRISQRVVVDGRVPYFGPHPVCGDAWVMASYDLSEPGRKVIDGFLSSKLVTGSDGPWIAPYRIDIDELERESVTVPAGTFDTRHFRIFYDEGKQQDTWVTDDFHFVKLRNEEIAVDCVLSKLESV